MFSCSVHHRRLASKYIHLSKLVLLHMVKQMESTYTSGDIERVVDLPYVQSTRTTGQSDSLFINFELSRQCF